MRFKNRVVIVTGGAKGIGAGCARVFAREGGIVVILDVDSDASLQLATELTHRGPGRVETITCDISQPHQLHGAIDVVATRHGRLDCLINNAGAHPPATSIEATRIEDVEALFRLNFLGTYVGCQAAVPHLRKAHGTIVNVSSMTAVLGQDRSSAYAATKGAQLSLTKALAVELGPQGIRVNAVLPSNVDTPLMRDWAATLDDPQTALDRVAALQVLGRMATPEEIGHVCLFLATEDSSFITGQGIEVEGGASLDY
ncbi:MAG: SDR family NAD(P)-dependent oxidoreductase [Planctomycetaceae bacterium]